MWLRCRLSLLHPSPLLGSGPASRRSQQQPLGHSTKAICCVLPLPPVVHSPPFPLQQGSPLLEALNRCCAFIERLTVHTVSMWWGF